MITSRDRHWEPLFDRMIRLRVGEGLKIGFTIQVDTLCHRIPNFIEKAAQAGVRRVFIGLENINPDSAPSARRNRRREQNALTSLPHPSPLLKQIKTVDREAPMRDQG